MKKIIWLLVGGAVVGLIWIEIYCKQLEADRFNQSQHAVANIGYEYAINGKSNHELHAYIDEMIEKCLPIPNKYVEGEYKQ